LEYRPFVYKKLLQKQIREGFFSLFPVLTTKSVTGDPKNSLHARYSDVKIGSIY